MTREGTSPASVAIKRLQLQVLDLAARSRRSADAAEVELDGVHRNLSEALMALTDRLDAIEARACIAPRHEWRGTELRFERPDGGWGSWVDLRGPQGYPGGVGVVQMPGGSEFDLDDLAAGDGSTPSSIILKQHDAWTRTSWATFLALIGSAPAAPPSLDFSDARNSQYIGAVFL